MKRHLHFLLLAVLVLGLTNACSSDDTNHDFITVDTAPLVISVQVLDLEGHSVLNDQTIQNISAIYKGKSYLCQPRQRLKENPDPATRYYMPHFYGLTYMNDYLIFGELDGTKTYTDEQLILCFGTEERDTITFSHHLEWDGTKQMSEMVYSDPQSIKLVESFRLNGQPVEGIISLRHALASNIVEDNDSTPRKMMPITQEQFPLISKVNTFGMNLFRQIVKEKQTESVVASPLSIAYLLGMLANGAPEHSQTQNEILQSLMGITSGSGTNNNGVSTDNCYALEPASSFNGLFQTLITWAPQVDSQVKLELADALFTRNDFPVYAGYVDLLARYYQADYAKLDFASPEALKYINDWASQKTHGLIPSILDEIPPSAVAYLFNALYFKAPWKVSFDKEYTFLQDFTLPNGSKRKLYLMHNYLETRAAETDTYTAVSLPFAKGAYSMDVILPAEGISTAQLTQDIDFQQIPWKKAEVIVTLPRFEVRSELCQLNDQLHRLGITRIFTQEAELTQLSPVEGIFVSRIFQKARIIINEEGGEAAAVSGAEVTTSMDPDQVHFTANRPFLFCIREASSGAVFFLGTFCGEEQQ